MSRAALPWALLLGTQALSAAAGERLLYENAQLRLLEVTRAAVAVTGSTTALPSIVAMPSAAPAFTGAVGTPGLPPAGLQSPWCQVRAAGYSSSGAVEQAMPARYYRVDYKRIDGAAFATRWREWHAWALQAPPATPLLTAAERNGLPLSMAWPFPAAYDALHAAPANHYLRYRDADVEFLEVMIRPGEVESLHGHPLPSVFFDDGGGFYPIVATSNEYPLSAAQAIRGVAGSPPAGNEYPQCFAAIPQAPHRVTATGKVPQHFYRLQFRR